MLTPVNGAWEGCCASQVSGEVAVSGADWSTAYQVGFCPQKRTTGGSIVQLEANIVVAVSGDRPCGRLEASLEVNGIRRSCNGLRWAENYAVTQCQNGQPDHQTDGACNA